MPPTVPAALTVPEQRIWARYAERIEHLRTDPRAAAVLERYRLAELTPGTPAEAAPRRPGGGRAPSGERPGTAARLCPASR